MPTATPKPLTLAALLVLLAILPGCAHGCDGENAGECGRACQPRPMLRYNQADGCICDSAAAVDGGK